MPREVQQEHVVAVAVAKLRGGVQPARVAHQPAVQEHDARAQAAQGPAAALRALAAYSEERGGGAVARGAVRDPEEEQGEGAQADLPP